VRTEHHPNFAPTVADTAYAPPVAMALSQSKEIRLSGIPAPLRVPDTGFVDTTPRQPVSSRSDGAWLAVAYPTTTPQLSVS
jgi:hypothetical protein